MFRRGAFTLIELLVVVAIIGLLMAMLLPSLRAARRAVRDVACQTNLRTHAQAFLLYGVDFGDQLPYFSEGVPGDPTSPNYSSLQDPREAGGTVWYELLVEHGAAYEGYEAEIGHHNDPRDRVWRCPNVTQQEMESVHGLTPTWGGGYGVAINVIGYAAGRSRWADGSPKTSEVHSSADLLLISDTGRPYVELAQGAPFVYSTWMQALDPPYNWINAKQGQVAARHTGERANIAFFDGHVDRVSYDAIQENRGDLFGLRDPRVTDRQ